MFANDAAVATIATVEMELITEGVARGGRSIGQREGQAVGLEACRGDRLTGAKTAPLRWYNTALSLLRRPIYSPRSLPSVR